MRSTEKEASGASGLSCVAAQDGSYCMYNEGDRRSHRDHVLRMKPDEIQRRLREDDAVFNIARQENLMEQPLFSKPVTEIKKPATNTFTFSQKKQLKMKEREQPEGGELEVRTSRSGLC